MQIKIYIYITNWVEDLSHTFLNGSFIAFGIRLSECLNTCQIDIRKIFCLPLKQNCVFFASFNTILHFYFCEIMFTFSLRRALMYANNFPYLLRSLSLILARTHWRENIYVCSENVNGNQNGNKCRTVYTFRDEDYILLPLLLLMLVEADVVTTSFCFYSECCCHHRQHWHWMAPDFHFHLIIL